MTTDSTPNTEEPSDEEMRKLLKPKCSLEEVQAAVQKSFAKAGQTIKILRELDSYDDQNFMAELTPGGTKYLIKVHNGVESKDFLNAFEKAGRDYEACTSVIHFQTAIMQQLSNNGVSTSDPQPSNDGGLPLATSDLPVVSEAHSPCPLIVKLLTWVPGRTMSSLKALPIECLLDAGKYLGKMHVALDKMDPSKHPASQRFHAWDGKNTVHVRDWVSAIATPQRRAMVESVISTFETDILMSGVGDKFRKGINQGDFNDANILVDEDFQVSGAIDFGDSTESWRILDLSVAMAYSMLTTYGQKGRSVSAAAAMLRGYNSVYPVTNLELQHLHLLVACRLACSCTLGAYSFSQNPENEYLLLHAQPAWDALEFLWGDSDKHRASTSSALKTVFEQACRSDLAEKCSDLAFPDPGFVDPLASMRESGPPAKRRKPNGDEKPTITFVTGNKKKLEEVQRILGTDLPFDITNKKVDLPELQGDSLEIAKEKCLEAARLVGGAVITEDTSLCFTALKDLPGPYIKWFLEKCGHEGLNNMIGTYDDKSGYAQTVVAFCPGPDQEVVIFDGRTKGKIVPARGKLDFGWDAIFEPDEGKGLTYAEMNKDEKDAISHRSRAMMQLKDYFSNEKDAIKHSLA